MSFCAGGRRLLRRWVCRPLQDAAAIGRRQDAVAELLARPDLMAAVRGGLRGLDIERSLGRAAAASQPPAAALPHDLTAAAQRRCLPLYPIIEKKCTPGSARDSSAELSCCDMSAPHSCSDVQI